MAPRTAILRADGSASIGMGHVMRCLAVAEALAVRRVTPVFVVRDEGAAALVRATGCQVEELAADAGGEEDARFTAKMAASHGARLIVTDLCHWDALRDVEALRDLHAALDQDHAVVALTGGDLTDVPATLVVAPYVHVPESADARVLAGPKYFVFRHAFVAAARQKHEIAREARRVLVTMGGADPEALTPHVLRALHRTGDASLVVHVVIGPRFAAHVRREIEAAAAELGDRCTLLPHDADLAGAMLWADLAITADGFTRYETAVTGTPSITLELPSSDGRINEIFAAAGTTHSVPNAAGMDEGVLAALVQSVLRDHEGRREMSSRGRRLLDGRGLERIFAALPAGVLA
jgi:spore coat polysaccharide biosynthesis predicted glycosyltransferase SpsG